MSSNLPIIHYRFDGNGINSGTRTGLDISSIPSDISFNTANKLIGEKCISIFPSGTTAAGANNRLIIPNWTTPTNFTISTWAKIPTRIGAGQSIVEFLVNNKVFALVFWINFTATTTEFLIYYNNTTQVVTIPNIFDNIYHHYLFTVASNSTTSTIKMYLDNSLINTVGFTLTLSNLPVTKTYIGSRDNLDPPIHGYMDDFKIYDYIADANLRNVIYKLGNNSATVRQLFDNGATISNLFAGDATISQLVNGGITFSELLTGGVTISQLVSAGYTFSQLVAGGITISQMVSAGYTISQLVAGGITFSQLVAGGITFSQLVSAGYTFSQLVAGGITISQLVSAGYTFSQLVAGGITFSQLVAGGITISQLVSAGYTFTELLSLTQWLDLSATSNVFNKTYVNNFVDLSGDMIIRNDGAVISSGDVSFNYITVAGSTTFSGDTTLKSKLFIGNDISVNGNLYVGGDLSVNGTFSGNFADGIIPTTAIINYPSSGSSNVEITGNVRVAGDASFNGTKVELNTNTILKVSGNVTFTDGTTLSTYDDNILSGSFAEGNVIFKDSTFAAITCTGVARTNTKTTSSDYRLKTNVTDLDGSYTVDKLTPVQYDNILSNKHEFGLIAHELQEVYPELVKGEKDGAEYQRVNYNGLIGVLVKEVQELNRRKEALCKK